MIAIRSEREIALLKKAGAIVGHTHAVLAKAIKPGITTRQLDEMAEEVITSMGATPSFKGYQGFPGSICTSINEMLVHGIPDDTVLKEGDIISIDIGACYKGYHGDSAWTYAVGSIRPEHQKLLDVTRESLFKGLEQVKAGNYVGDIAHAIQSYVESFGYSLPIEYTGHGVGSNLHEDPAIPNVGKPRTLQKLKKGMVIAVEPMVFMGRPNTKTLSDGWGVVSKDGSLAAHFEHTVVVCDDGYDITTIREE